MRLSLNLFLLTSLSVIGESSFAAPNIRKVQIEGKYYTYNPKNIYFVKGRRIYFKIGKKGEKTFRNMPATEEVEATVPSAGQPLAPTTPAQAVISADQTPPFEPAAKNKDQIKETPEVAEATDGVDNNDGAE